jgi:hypothetical protein
MKEFYKNKKIVITGAASGIGRDLALLLNQFGATLFLIDIQQIEQDQFENLASISFYKGDVTHQSQMNSIKDEILSKTSLIDIVIAAAGVGGLNPGMNFSIPTDQKVMSINYFGTINSLVPFIESMIKNHSGHLVGISSLAAYRGLPQAASYSASKAAQMTLLESLRLDLKKSGIYVSSIHPGFVETPMANHSDFEMPFKVSVRKSSFLILKAIMKKKKQYAYPWPMALLSKINRFLPNFIYDFLLPRLNPPQVTNAKIFSGSYPKIDDLK